MKTTKRALLLAALLAALGAAPAARAADDYPSRPITLIVPFAAGGPTDELGRALAKSLSEILKQPVIVNNRTGAGGSIGMDFVAKAPPDGYTLGMGHTGTQSINPSLYAKLPYDSLADFAPISPVVSYTNVLVVNAALPVHTVAEFVAWAKAHPKEATFASGGIGATNHLSGELLKSLTGAPLVHVPYKGNAPAMLDLVSGNVACMFDIPITALPQIRAGKVRALAVTSRRRSSDLPDVPTMREAGVPAYDEAGNDLWFGLFAPAKTPPAIVAKLNAAVVKAVARPEVQKLFAERNVEAKASTPDELMRIIKDEIAQWGPIVKKANIQM